jgi:hypothetical protein
MTTFLRGEQAVISRLRVGGAGLDPLVTRLRMSSLLDATELHPRSLPLSAVVCVRRLSAPPAALRQTRGGAHTPRAQHAWQRALADTVERIAARAPRPIEGAVPPTAEAVVFADRAELLACLALDWRARVMPERWWWEGILKGSDAERALLAEWSSAPEHIPAALEHLAQRGLAAEFVGALEVDAARLMSQRVAQVFALHGLRVALAPGGSGSEEATFNEHAARTQGEGSGRALAARIEALVPPWRRVVPESRAHAIALEQECLLGIGLTLARAPTYARAPSFTSDVLAWRGAYSNAHGAAEIAEGVPDAAFVDERLEREARSEEGESFETTAQGSSTARQSPSAQAEKLGLERETARRAGDSWRESGEAERPEALESPSIARPRRFRQGARGEEPGVEEGRADEAGKLFEFEEGRETGGRSATSETDARAGEGAEEVRPVQVLAEREAEVEALPVLPYLLEARIETKLGGLFYLINVGLFLELYGDFTMPSQPGLALSVWDFVTLVGRRLCVAGNEDEEDAVWRLLSRLAGRREEEPAGLGFEPPDEWRLPVSWLKPFPQAGLWRWSARGGRLRVRHQEGFMLIDVALGRRAGARQVRDALKAYEPFADFELRREAWQEDEGDAGGLERWVEWLAAYVRARLCRALGAGGPGELASLLIEQGARVSLTATHVDVLFQLAALPLEVRLSGLDRDPGWVPAAGRFIAFRYV